MTNRSVLCIRHFKEEDIDRTSQCRVRLRPNAIPTLYVEPIFSTPMKPSAHDDHNYCAVMLNKPLSTITPRMETISNVVRPALTLSPDNNYTEISNETVPKIRRVSSNNDVPLIVHADFNTRSWNPSQSTSIHDDNRKHITIDSKSVNISDAIDTTPQKKKLLSIIDKIHHVSYSRKKKIDSMRKKMSRQSKKIASLNNIIKDLRQQRLVTDDNLEILS